MAMRPVFGVVGVPTFGQVSIDWALNFHMIGAGLAVYVAYSTPKNKRVDVAKNEICQQAVDQNADWVFFLDDDVIPPSNVLMKCIKNAFGPPYLDIINGVYFSKSEPPMPLMFRGDMKGSVWNWHVGDLIKIDAAGMGCTFIKTKVLKEIKEKVGGPWFSVDYTYNPNDPNDFPAPSIGATEDLYFYKKARECGFQTWADTSIQCVHEDRKNNLYYQLPDDYPQATPGSDIKPRGKKLILDIGCGSRSPYFEEGVPVRLDLDEKNKPDIVASWNNIPEPDCKYDIVFASHALEHNEHRRVGGTLKEWLRVLKVGGEIRIVVPNLQFVAERLLKDEGLEERDMWILYSAQKDEHDYHKVGFTPKLLKDLLEGVGCLEDIKVWTSRGNWSNWKENPGNYNILASAKKVKHLKTESIVDETVGEYSPEETEGEIRRGYKIGAPINEPEESKAGQVSKSEAKRKKIMEEASKLPKKARKPRQSKSKAKKKGK